MSDSVRIGDHVGDLSYFLSFQLLRGERRALMALNVQKVKEVVELEEGVAPLPIDFAGVLGILNLRGCPVPILDLSILTKSVSMVPLETMKRLLVCELKNMWVAIPVGKTDRVFSCRDEDFLPPPMGGAIENSRLITGLIRRKEQLLPVLDIDGLVEKIMGPVELSENVSVQRNGYPGKKVLVVDDSKAMRKHLVTFFEKLGFVVASAENGKEALDQCADPSAYFDLIFTDVEMPVMNGIALARQLRGSPKWAEIPIIFNSSLSNANLIADTQAERLGYYLVKFDEDLILRHLAIVFGQS